MAELAHILAVDDDASVRRMLQILLTNAGYRVSLASSGEEAMAYLELVTPDLVLLDISLPGLSGRQVMERIKADPDRPFIPVILITGHSDLASKVAALDAGADDFLVKPVDLTELLARVRAMLRLQRSQRSLRAEQRKTELLLHLTRELGTTLDLDQLLTQFLNRLADAVGAVRASILVLMSDQPRFFSSTRNRPTIPLNDILSQGVAGWVLRERKPLVIADTREDPRWIAVNAQQRAVRSVAAVPLVREGRALAAITLVHHTPGYFNRDHLELLNAVAAQSAVALENAELFHLTRTQRDLLERRAEELQRINQISRYLTELMSTDQLLRLVVHLIHHTFGYPLVAVALQEDERLVLRAAAGSAIIEQAVGQAILPDASAAGRAIAQREAYTVADFLQTDCYPPAGAERSVRSELAVPIQTARQVFGALSVMAYIPNAFGDSDVRLLSTLASQLGIALDNARLFNMEQRRVRQLGMVNNLSIAMTARLDAAENLTIAAHAIASIFEVAACGIVLTNPRAQSMRNAVFATDAARNRVPWRILAETVVLSAPQVLSAADALLAPCASDLATAGVTALALAPLLAGGKQIGLIALDVSGHERQFQSTDLTLLETVASLLAQVIENACLYREVEDERSTLGAVLRSAADPILLIDSQSRLVLANPAAEQRLHLTGAIGRLVDDAVSNRDLIHALNDASPNGQSVTEVTLADGSTFNVSVAPVRSADDSLIGRVAVMQDITAIKELERAEQERLRAMFRRYVSPQVVEEVLAGGGEFGVPRECDIVVLFADIRGYTTLAEGLAPQVLVHQILNRYFTAMTETLYKYGGTVDKFLGDGLIGVFGVPIARDDDVPRSLRAAVDLQLAFADLRKDWRRDLGLDLGMGVGVAYGPALVGNIGSPQRLDYTVIGDVVNTANRLSGLARADQIIVSYRLIDALPPGCDLPWQLRPIGPVMLKGKHEPHMAYEIVYQVAVSGGV
ncbi:MAG: GAF domain-containing protein [Roseiflexus sp.]|nr:GAF domain-containing protein [Roseiflexus sp.]MCS7289844.1 GAF domain-containing protein [Roseiflexus sp.]MDW8146580.1 GAF domain-containing protein [Roseiflexaceae bacterium]MDW8231144.1 GAF domain-containing protein [Roseiflexaceae bacterium]